MKEIWRVIPKHPIYEVSNKGNIRNRKTKTLKKIRKYKDGGNYISCSCTLFLSKGKVKPVRVNRIVCEVFNGPPPTTEHHAAHKNGISTDNTPENLYWATSAENIYDQFKHGTFNCKSGGKPKKITNEMLQKTLTLRSQGLSWRKIEKIIGTANSGLRSALKRRLC